MTTDRRIVAEAGSTRKPTRVVPGWLPAALMCLLVVVVARQGVRPISDPDTFWHLELGDRIIDSRSVTSVTDAWSSLSDQPWVPTQWLTELVMAAAERTAGLPGVAWLFAVSLIVLVLVLHRAARLGADAVPAAFATGLTIAAMSASLSPRPHMVTYMLLAVTVLAWRRSAVDLRPRWWLVPLTWLWAMCHGMWFLGPLVGLVVLAGLALDGRLAKQTGMRLLVVSGASIVAAALTPAGPALLEAPFAVAGVGGFITEWQPPSFRTPAPAAAGIMVALVVMVWARNSTRVPWASIAMLGLGAAWILLATRTVAIGAVMVAPILAASLQELLGRASQAETWRERRSLDGIAFVTAILLLAVVPRTAPEPAGVPSSLDAALDSLDPGVVFNSYELGGWLRWRHPDLEPVVDGMTEAYSVEHLRAYAVAQAAAPGWQQVFRDWSPELALLPEQSPLALALQEHGHWLVVDRDGGYVLLRTI